MLVISLPTKKDFDRPCESWYEQMVLKRRYTGFERLLQPPAQERHWSGL
jgi:hypothetical protein